MKKIFIIVALVCLGVKGFCQQDSSSMKKDSVTHHHHGKKLESLGRMGQRIPRRYDAAMAHATSLAQ